jgi:acyl-CoA thioesterase
MAKRSQRALDLLISILDLEKIEVNTFRGRSPEDERQRVFGGQVAGQALVAAGRTIEGRVVHSLLVVSVAQEGLIRPVGQPTA